MKNKKPTPTKRSKKPTKSQQIEFLHEKLDQFAVAMQYLMQYMDMYGITPHYQEWVEGSATDKPLPNKLVVGDEPMHKVLTSPGIEEAQIVEDGES